MSLMNSSRTCDIYYSLDIIRSACCLVCQDLDLARNQHEPHHTSDLMYLHPSRNVAEDHLFNKRCTTEEHTNSTRSWPKESPPSINHQLFCSNLTNFWFNGSSWAFFCVLNWQSPFADRGDHFKLECLANPPHLSDLLATNRSVPIYTVCFLIWLHAAVRVRGQANVISNSTHTHWGPTGIEIITNRFSCPDESGIEGMRFAPNIWSDRR